MVRSSNRLVARFAQDRDQWGPAKQAQLTKMFRSRYPWFGELATRGGGHKQEGDRIARFVERNTEIDGIEVGVVELVGEPGDVVLCHPWLFHASSMNVQPQPRLMRAARFYKRGLLTPADT